MGVILFAFHSERVSFRYTNCMLNLETYLKYFGHRSPHRSFGVGPQHAHTILIFIAFGSGSVPYGILILLSSIPTYVY